MNDNVEDAPQDEIAPLDDARTIAFDLLSEILTDLYGARDGDELETISGAAAWAAFDLLLALTIGAIGSYVEIEDESDEDGK